MALPKYYEAISHPTYRDAPIEKQKELNDRYWKAYEAENPGDEWGQAQAEDSRRSLEAKDALSTAAPITARALELQRTATNARIVARNRDAAQAWSSPEERQQFLAEANTSVEAEKAKLKKTFSLFKPEVEKEMQPAWEALKTTALEGGVFGERSVRSDAMSGPMGNALAGRESQGSVKARKQYEAYRDTLAKDFNLTPEEVDDLVKHRMGLQKDPVSRDALGQFHIKDELLAKGNQEVQAAIAQSNLPDKVKSDLSIEAPQHLARFKSGVVENVKKNHPELAADITWSGDTEKDYKALNDVLNTTRTEQFGGGLKAAAAGRATMFAGAPMVAPGGNVGMPPNVIPTIDRATAKSAMERVEKKQASVNQLSNFINQEKVRILGTDAATVGAGVYSGVESVAIGAVTGGLGTAIVSADRIKKAGTVGKILLGGAQRGLNTAPIASIYGLEQGIETYERTGDVGMSLLSAAIEGGVTTAFGAVKLGGTEDLGQRLANPAVREAIGKSVGKAWLGFGVGVSKTITGEQLEELTISALNDLYVESKLNPGMTVADMKKNLRDTAVATLFASGPMGAITAASEQGTNLFRSTAELTDDQAHNTADALYKAAAQKDFLEAEAARRLEQAPSPERMAELRAEKDELTKNASSPEGTARLKEIEDEMRYGDVQDGGRAITPTGLERAARRRMKELQRERDGEAPQPEKIQLPDGTWVDNPDYSIFRFTGRTLSPQEQATLEALEEAFDGKEDEEIDHQALADMFNLVLKKPKKGAETKAPVVQMTREELQDSIAENSPEDVGRPLEEVAKERGVEIVEGDVLGVDGKPISKEAPNLPPPAGFEGAEKTTEQIVEEGKAELAKRGIEVPTPSEKSTEEIVAEAEADMAAREAKTGSDQEGTGTAEAKAEGKVATSNGLTYETKSKTVKSTDPETGDKIERPYNELRIKDPSSNSEAYGELQSDGTFRIAGINARPAGNTTSERVGKVSGTRFFERTVRAAQEAGATSIEVNLQSADTRAVLPRLVEKGVLTNPRQEAGLSTDRHPTLFDITPTTQPNVQEKSQKAQQGQVLTTELPGETPVAKAPPAKDLLNASLEEIAQAALENPNDVNAAMLVFAAAGLRPASLQSGEGKMEQGKLFQDPNQPKGTYTPKAIAKAAGVSRAVLGLLEGKSDASTGIHESGHTIEDFLREIGEGDKADALEAWAKENVGDDWRKKREHIARGFERFVVNGVKTGVESVDRAFARIAEVMLNIYKGVKGSSIDKGVEGSSIDIDIPPHIEKIFNDLLSRGAELEAAGKKPLTLPVDVVKKPSATATTPTKKKAVRPLPPKLVVEKRETEGVDDFGVRKTVTDAIRREHGMPESGLGVSMTDQDAWDEALLRVARAAAYEKASPEAQAKMPNPPLVGKALLEDLIDNPRNTDKVEKALLAHEGLVRERVVDKARVTAKAVPDTATAAKRADVQEKLNRAIEDLQLLLDVVRIQGSRAGLALQAMKLVVNRQFELSRMLADARAAKNAGSDFKKDLDAGEIEKITKLSEKLRDMVKERDSLQESLKERELEVQALLKKMEEQTNKKPRAERKTITVVVTERSQAARQRLVDFGASTMSPNKTSVLDRMANAARQRIRDRAGRTSAGVDPTILFDVTVIAAQHIRNGLKTLAEVTARIVEDLGENFRKYAEPAFNNANASIESDSKNGDLVGDLTDIAADYTLSGMKSDEVKAKLVEEFGPEFSDLIDKALEGVRTTLNKASAGSRAKTPTELFNLLDPENPDLSNKLVFNMVRGMINEGVPKEKVLKKVLAKLREKFPELTYDELSDIFTGYGKVKFPSQEEDLKAVRELRNIERIQRQIREIESGNVPKKTGQQRDAATARIRELQKELQEAFRAAGIRHTTSATQLKGALDAIKTRLKNELEDLDKAIRTATPISRKKTQVEYDQEIKDLQAKRDALRKDYDKLFGVNRKAMTDAQRLKATIKALNARITEEKSLSYAAMVNRIKSSSKPVTDAEVERLRATLTALVDARTKARAALYPSMSEEDRAAKRAETASKRLVDYYQKILAGLPVDKKAPVKFTPSEELAKLITLKENLKAAVKEMRKQARLPFLKTKEERSRNAAIKALERSVADLEARLKRGDLSPRTRAAKRTDLPSELMKRQKAAQDALKALREAKLPSKEQRREQSLIRTKETRLKKIEERIRTKDYVDPPKPDPLITKKIAALDTKISEAKNTFEEMRRQWVLDNKSLGGKAWYYAKGILQLRKIIVLGAELGVVGRQGNIFTITGLVWHPARVARVLAKATRSFSKEAEVEIYNAMMEDPLAMWFPTLEKKGGWKLHNPHDEGYGNKEDLPDPELLNKLAKLRGIGIPAQAVLGIERFTRVFLNAARVEMLRSFAKQSRGEPTLDEMILYSNAVMNATGRGSFRDQRLDTGVALGNTLTISTRWLLSRAKVTILQPIWTSRADYAGTIKARAKIAFELYGKTILARTALVQAVSLALKFALDDDDEEEVELNPLSSKFGALRYKGATIDISGGLRQHINLIVRLARGERVSASGELIKLRGEGSSRFKGDTDQEIWNFIRSRSNINVGFALDVIKGKFYNGETVGVANTSIKLVSPIIVGDTIQLFKKYGPVEAAILWNAMFFGATVSPPLPPKPSSSGGGPLKLKLDLDLDLDLKLKP